MKKMIFITAITFFTLNSCKKEVAAPVVSYTLTQDQPRSVASTTASGNAAVPFHGIFEENLDGFQFYDACTNDLVTLHGYNQFVFHGFYDGPDSKLTVNLTVPATISAVGESGREYIFTATLNAQEGEYSKGEFTFKFIFKYRIITKGGGNNFFYELTHYLKVDDAGNWTVIRGEVEKTYCR